MSFRMQSQKKQNWNRHRLRCYWINWIQTHNEKLKSPYHVWVKEWYAWITSLEAIVDSDWSMRSPSFSDLYVLISVIIWNNRSNTNSSALLPNVVQTAVINARLLRVFHKFIPRFCWLTRSQHKYLLKQFLYNERLSNSSSIVVSNVNILDSETDSMAIRGSAGKIRVWSSSIKPLYRICASVPKISKHDAEQSTSKFSVWTHVPCSAITNRAIRAALRWTKE